MTSLARRSLVAGALLFLTAGCAASTQSAQSGSGPSAGAQLGTAPATKPSTTTPSTTTSARAALAAWASFPITAAIRPMVMTAEPIIGPASGFRTDDAKLAYLAGRFNLATTLPAAATTNSGFRITAAARALQQLRASTSNQPAPVALTITSVTLTSAKFGTDRGPRQLPAWSFTLAGVTDPILVLAIDPAILWPRPMPAGLFAENSATISADDRTLTYTFSGAPSGPSPCGASYAAAVTATSTAIVITPEEIKPNPLGSKSGASACPAIAQLRTVQVQLSAPLGKRVLINPDATPISVRTS